MKIFFHYERDSNEPLIEKIKSYLSKDAEWKLKHGGWIDKSDIKAGKDWRDGITCGFGCGFTEFFIIHPKDDSLATKYLHVILHMKCNLETAMLFLSSSAGLQRVPSSYLENLDLPLHPKKNRRR